MPRKIRLCDRWMTCMYARDFQDCEHAVPHSTDQYCSRPCEDGKSNKCMVVKQDKGEVISDGIRRKKQEKAS